MQQITLAEASQNLPDLIEAALSGEEIIIREMLKTPEKQQRSCVFRTSPKGRRKREQAGDES
jgi:antitoxin (DNA-binding transcriptional repressor) of toxin-antitoxin stability system